MINTENYNKLENYINALGYSVVNSDCDSWHAESKIICNNIRRTQENRIIYLAHECGHAILYKDKESEYLDIFPGLSKIGINNKISSIEQEVLAWNEGLNLLRKLKIPVNLKKFFTIKSICLRSYL